MEKHIYVMTNEGRLYFDKCDPEKNPEMIHFLYNEYNCGSYFENETTVILLTKEHLRDNKLNFLI